MPFFLLLDSFWLLFASAATGAAVFAASAAALSVAGASVFAGSAVVAASVELAALASAFGAVAVSLVPEVVSSAPAGFAGAGSPGRTVSTTAVEPDELPAPPLDPTSVVRFPPLNVSVGPLSDSGSIWGFP